MGFLANENLVLMCTPPTASVTGKTLVTGMAKAGGAALVTQITITDLSGQGDSGTIQSIVTPGTIMGSTTMVTTGKQPIVQQGDQCTVDVLEQPTGSPSPVAGAITVTVQSAGQTFVQGK